MKKFRIKRTTSTTWSAPLTKGEVMERWSLRARQDGGPFRLREDSAEWGPFKKFDDAKSSLNKRLEEAKIGEKWLTDTNAVAHISILVVDVAVVPIVPDSPGTTSVDKTRYYLYKKFSSLESWGICNCRPISGTTIWSQHSWCNAEDVHGSFAVMDAASKWLALAAQNKGGEGVPDLPVAKVIFNRRCWTPSTGWYTYSGQNPHTDHVHWEGAPTFSGRPPCA